MPKPIVDGKSEESPVLGTAASKGDRMKAFVQNLPAEPGQGWPPCYQGYFYCFNRGDYYEAHDVLEHLWLESTGKNWEFYKGLIQFAGAFVHLQKQHRRPGHPTDGRRLHPAVRLFRRSADLLSGFGPFHEGLDVAGVLRLCEDYARRIEKSRFRVNPWLPGSGPRLELGPPEKPL